MLQIYMCDTLEYMRNNCQTCERKSFQMSPTWCEYFLHRWSPIFIFDLKWYRLSSSDTDYLISCGTKHEIFSLKWDRVSVLL